MNKSITLKPGREIPILAGHPWIFSNGIREISVGDSTAIEPGELIEVRAHDSLFLGMGLFGAGESIKVRMISREKLSELNGEFFEKKFRELDELKFRYLPEGTDGFRLVYADADYLPGLIIDRYGDNFVFQIHTAGMEKFRSEIIDVLKKAFSPVAIVERSNIEVRKQEGLAVMKPIVHFGNLNAAAPIVFSESGIKFYVDVLGGQKTGFFLDQRDARRKVGELSAGRKVLNLFSYTGAFSLYAALGGAKTVTSVDVSQSAIEMCKKNFELNAGKFPAHAGVNDVDFESNFICSDVFEFLNHEVKVGDYDLIICDPPAFAKGGAHLEQAKEAYIGVNQKCFELLEIGGILATSSCSGRLGMEDFRNVIKIAAGRARKNARVLAALGQAFDHTDKISFPEGRYLKTLILEVI